jgi:hypothetical protein
MKKLDVNWSTLFSCALKLDVKAHVDVQWLFLTNTLK